MSKTVFSVLAFLGFALAAAFAHDEPEEAAKPDQWTIIHAGTLIARPGETPLREKSVVIKNDRIEAVVDGYTDTVEGADKPDVVDLTDAYVMPGLIDVHVHLGLGGDRAKGRDEENGDDAYRMVNIIDNANKTLMAGYTTVRDVGAYGWGIFAFRDAVKEGVLPGPRVFAAGHTIEIGTLDRDGPGACYDVPSCKKAVRRQIEMGADWLKVYATCSGSKPCGREDAPPVFTEEELRAVLETAATREVPVAAHGHATAGINAALRAGVRSIEHGSYNDEESRRLLKRNNAFLTPTLAVEDNIIRDYETASDEMKPVMEGFMDQHPKRAAAAYKAGVKIAAGSDAGVVAHGDNANELLWLVKIGMSEADALRAATVVNADLLGKSAELGTIASGKLADIIALDENPLANIEAVKNVSFVMANGKIVKNRRGDGAALAE